MTKYPVWGVWSSCALEGLSEDLEDNIKTVSEGTSEDNAIILNPDLERFSSDLERASSQTSRQAFSESSTHSIPCSNLCDACATQKSERGNISQVRESPQFLQPDLVSLIERHDVDGDGMLDKDEMQALLQVCILPSLYRKIEL